VNNLEKNTLLPGKIIVATKPTLISTLLGSCVAVCLWDKRLRIGGMNHYLLPGTEHADIGDANRGASSIRMLLDTLISHHSYPVDLEAKIFGGCNSLYRNNDLYKIGERNIAIAFEMMTGVGIPVIAHHTGGALGRKIVFNTSNGKVRMRLLPQLATEVNEKNYQSINY
jgi:chemotaxis protein CheD